MLALRYDAHGLSFMYAPEVKVSAFARPGRGMNIKAEAPSKHGHMFGFVAMTYLEPRTPERAYADAVQGMELVYEPPSKINARTTVARVIAGLERSGERFEIEWDNSPVIELYALELNGRTICISLQYDAEDAARAEEIFGPILRTLA